MSQVILLKLNKFQNNNKKKNQFKKKVDFKYFNKIIKEKGIFERKQIIMPFLNNINDNYPQIG